MEPLSLNYYQIIKSSFASFHHYSSDTNLNHHHLQPILMKDESTSTEKQECKNNFHKCHEGSIEVVSYEQFIKLLKPGELK
jgi:hypothetical protein